MVFTFPNLKSAFAAVFLTLVVFTQAFSQAYFSGNISDAVNKTSITNAKIMVVNGADTTYHLPDKNGNFKFSNKAGRNKIYVVADDYVAELNSVEASNGSKNTINVAMVNKKLKETYKNSSTASRGVSSDPETEPMRKRYKPTSGYRDGSATFIDGMRVVDELAVVNLGKTNGYLSAGELSDFSKWNYWQELSSNLFAPFKEVWKFEFDKRYCVQVSNEKKTPLVDAIVKLYSGETVVWEARTDNTGKAELWLSSLTQNLITGALKVSVEFNGISTEFSNPTAFQDGINFVSLLAPCAFSDQLDIAFVIDATGSMGDEIYYIQQTLDSLISQTAKENANINLRMGSVFYKDLYDDYVTAFSPFSSDSKITGDFIMSRTANGGGDFPEAMDSALSMALHQLAWSSSARARILFLLCDAPPHNTAAHIAKMQTYIKLAAAKGVRIVPVACSGIDKNTEFVLRSMALATNGTYAFLTNHGGIGNPHIEPSTNEDYKVESLQKLMSRVLREFSTVPNCNNEIDANFVKYTDTAKFVELPDNSDSSLTRLAKQDSVQTAKDTGKTKPITVVIKKGWVKFYPNPTQGPLTIEVHADINQMYLADVGGKLLQKISCKNGDKFQINIGQYSAGIYFLQYPTSKGWVAERIILGNQ